MAVMTRRTAQDERGWLLVTSMIVLLTMMTFALTSFTLVDRGREHSLDQRQRESALNLAEGVLYSQGFALALKWPGNAVAGAAMPATCTEVAPAAALAQYCPAPSTLAAAQGSPATANFANTDSLTNVTWTGRVRDNGGPNLGGAYVSGTAAEATQSGTNVRTGASYTCPGPCRWDANGDRQLWVQARAVVQGKARNIVALLKREQFAEAFARNGVTAGSFETTNNGNKTIINATGSQVVVRCTSLAAACTNYNAAKSQVLPVAIVRDPATPPAMSAVQIARFKAAAQSASPSSYHTSCPASLTGTVVFIDVPSTTNCTDSNSAVYNSATEPGIVIMPRGRLTMKGTLHGLIYMANEQASAGPVLTLEANSEVLGGVAIDGAGRLVVGQASGNRSTVAYVANAFNTLSSYGTTGLVQNTWRELPAN
jgi:Tfp pilus assembly protein PilX